MVPDTRTDPQPGPRGTSWCAVEGGLLPPGAAWVEEERACNFTLYSRHAERVTLLLYGPEDPARPLVIYELDPRSLKTCDVWHCRLAEEDVRGARYYAYQVDGPRATGRRPGFDPDKILLDPAAKEVYFPSSFDRETARRPGPNPGVAPSACSLTPSRRSTGRTIARRVTRPTR